MRAVLFGLLRHQTHVGHGAHGAGVEVAVPLAEVDHLLVDAGKGRLGHHGLAVVRLAVGTPHLAALADHGGHGGVHDDVVGRMEVGDALGRVHHGQRRTVFLAGVQVTDDLFALGGGQRLDLLVQRGHAVVHVDAQLVEQLAVLLEGFLVIDLHAVAEHDRVRDLHHRGLDVQREQDAGFLAVVQLLFVEVAQRLLAHEHRVDDLAVLERHFFLQHNGLAGLGLQHHLHVTGLVQGHGLFAVVEVAFVHVRDVGLRPLLPLGHRVGVLLGVVLHGRRCAAVGVAFTQHGVHSRTQAFAITGLDGLFCFIGRVLRIVGDGVALALQLLDGGLQLRHGGRDVGQLDDVGFRRQRQLAQFGQGVGHTLVLGQQVAELAQDTRRHGNVAGLDIHASSGSESLHDGQECAGGQTGRFIRQGVDDGGLLCCHLLLLAQWIAGMWIGLRRLLPTGLPTARSGLACA